MCSAETLQQWRVKNYMPILLTLIFQVHGDMYLEKSLYKEALLHTPLLILLLHVIQQLDKLFYRGIVTITIFY